jgi:hypothetical protein
VPGEEQLKFSVILAMDGNESQRRSVRHGADPRRYNSSLYISEDVVETFANETKASKKKKKVRDYWCIEPILKPLRMIPPTQP